MADSSRLLLDVMLGKLATYLRMCGYDAAYALEEGADGEADEEGIEDDDALLELAGAEDRTLLTRDTQLAARADDSSRGGLLLESRDVTDQLRELRDAGFDLSLSNPTRCSACNGRLAGVESGTADRVPDYVPNLEERRVWRCRECGKHFWKGSHWESVEETLSGM
jgi:uncharacterized protein with PIN domain